jgi:hypothetical protein
VEIGEVGCQSGPMDACIDLQVNVSRRQIMSRWSCNGVDTSFVARTYTSRYPNCFCGASVGWLARSEIDQICVSDARIPGWYVRCLTPIRVQDRHNFQGPTQIEQFCVPES